MNEELLNEFSSILKEKNIDINDLLNNFQNSNSESSTNNQSNGTDDNNSENNSNNTSNSSEIPDFIDISTILKIKNLMSKYKNANSQNVQLLMSLKPFLRKSRQEKLDKYTQMLKIAELFENLDIFGGD